MEALMFAPLLSAILFSAVPNYDVQTLCRSESDLAQDEADFNSCIHDERSARGELAKHWTTYPLPAKNICLSNTGIGLGHSYVELVTCFEIENWKNHLNDIGGTVGGAATGGSPPTPTQMGGFSATHPLGGSPAVHVR
jgi:hypothetical protein